MGLEKQEHSALEYEEIRELTINHLCLLDRINTFKNEIQPEIEEIQEKVNEILNKLDMPYPPREDMPQINKKLKECETTVLNEVKQLLEHHIQLLNRIQEFEKLYPEINETHKKLQELLART